MRPVPPAEEMLVPVLAQVELRDYLAQLGQGLAEKTLALLGVVMCVGVIVGCLKRRRQGSGEEDEKDSVVGVEVVGSREGRSTGGGRHWRSEAVCSVYQLDMGWCGGS